MKMTISLKKSNLIFALLLACFTLSSCEDVIPADLTTGEENIVIDAEILWQKGTDGSVQTIRISRMTGYYSPETPKVSGAQVSVENSAGNQFTFSETVPGVYTCTNFIPELNGIYTLHVAVDGEVYTATETLIPVPEITGLEQLETGGFSGDETEVAIYYNDTPNQANYYLVSFLSPTLPYPDYELSVDNLSDGNEMKADFSDEDLKPGDTLEITLSGISHQFYNYMSLILQAADSSPFDTPPANIKGNILNQDSNGSPALGYFRICESDYRSYVVE